MGIRQDDSVVQHLVNTSLARLFRAAVVNYDLKGEISPGQSMRLEKIRRELRDLLKDYINTLNEQEENETN